MKRYILTGAPGAGKTMILRALERRGYAVVEEAASDTCALAQATGDAEPWTSPRFIDDIVELQRRRQEQAAASPGSIQIFDRSPVCTLALARFLGFPVSDALARELRRIGREAVYEGCVFFVEGLGFMANTAVRRISLEEAQRFGETHESAYREFGFDLVRIEPGPVADRADAVARSIESWGA
jgi:predicted ATPase